MQKNAANEYRGETSLFVGGKERKIRYGLNTLANLQKEAGLPLLDVIGALERLDIIVLRAVLWAGLNDDSISPEDVGDMIDKDIEEGKYRFDEIVDKSTKALMTAFNLGKGEKGKGKN